jgi:hypothetical protein
MILKTKFAWTYICFCVNQYIVIVTESTDKNIPLINDVIVCLKKFETREKQILSAN